MPTTLRVTTAFVGLVLVTAVSATEDPGTCPVPTSSLECSSEFIDSISIADGSALGVYTCGSPFAPLDQFGPENVYAFACQQSGDVTVVLDKVSCDLDLYVLDETCDSESGCLAGDTSEGSLESMVTFTCAAEEIYIIAVEGFGFTGGRGALCKSPAEYRIRVEVGAGTGCPEDCDDGLDNDLDGLTDCDDSDCSSESMCSCDTPEDCELLIHGFEEDPRIIFTTSAAFNGDLMTAGSGANGLEGADNICNDLASTAGLPGTYTAWLSDSTAHAKDRVTQHYSVYRTTNGDKVADNFADIIDCPGVFPTQDCLDNPINYDENGVFIPGALETWTGTRESGNLWTQDEHCDNWTDATGKFDGRLGRITDTGSTWTGHTARSCDHDGGRLYCFQD